MPDVKNKLQKITKTYLQVAGVLLLILLALLLLWFNNSTSNQAVPALVAQVYFDGEYRIGDGEWNDIVQGEHIPSTKGDVTLRGNFHMLTPDGEYVDIYRGEIEMFKDCGICFVLLPQLKNCGINGAVKWINKQKVVLAINDRMHYADVFWFSLFHEIKHVLQKKITKTIISGIYQTDIDATLEDEANLFSRNTLIPADKFNKYRQSPTDG